MWKKISGLILAAVTMFACLFGMPGTAFTVWADEGVTIKLHYNRPDGDYEPWRVWFWEVGGEGADYFFEETDGEQVATMEVSPGTTSVGFIIRTESWSKDVDLDQFIDITEVTSGTVHIYVESQVEGYTKEYGDGVEVGVKLRGAVYDDGVIRLQMTGTPEDPSSAFLLSDQTGEIGITSLQEEADYLYIAVPEKELNPFGAYTVSYEGTEYAVSMPVMYSEAEFEEAYTYTGDDLGAVWTPEKTVFRVWAPTAEAVSVKLYQWGDPEEEEQPEILPMTADENGTWVAEKEGDQNGVYYSYQVTHNGVESEACDPYARTTGVNGSRAMVIDLDGTDPEGWENDRNPHAGESITDAVIYELHMRDFSADESAGIEHVGKFLQFTEKGTKTPGGAVTGVDYLKELGITHLHILPMYDFGSVDERTGGYNWGYDPVNYNVPEGSYSTDPYDGAVRVNEMKQMIQALHTEGISVVMDVVYNHVQSAGDFCFNQLVPGYFSRMGDDGSYSNGSGCGNDTASERSMVRKYIVDSVSYWAEEYHIDGFRFDLVGLLDVDTVNAIVEEVHKTHPDVIFYGEGWSMATNVTKDGVTLATQLNSAKTPGFAYFNDSIRDGLKGNVFNETEKGYVSGAMGLTYDIARAFMGNSTWCTDPTQTINYASCHDNLTLFDRLQLSRKDASREELIRMNNLAAAVYMTSQGVPFLQAGEEMLRTKVKEDGSFENNSYQSGDALNSIKWSTLEEEEYQNVAEYYKGLIAFRKAHSVLRLNDMGTVKEHVEKISGTDLNVLAMHLTGGVEGETAEEMFIVFNPNEEETNLTLPEGTWGVYVNANKAGTECLETVTGTVAVEPISAMVLIREGGKPGESASQESTLQGEPSDSEQASETSEEAGGSNVTVVVVCAVTAAAVVGILFGAAARKKRRGDKEVS